MDQQNSPTFPADCLPPESSYQSREALFKAINEWAASRGYAFVTGRSTREKNSRQIVTYQCDRSGKPPSSTQSRQRQTTTRRTHCLFSILAKQSSDGIWSIRHRPDQRFAVHNHQPSWDPSAHPTHRQLSLSDRSKLLLYLTRG